MKLNTFISAILFIFSVTTTAFAQKKIKFEACAIAIAQAFFNQFLLNHPFTPLEMKFGKG